jgi:hypothetical protein
MLFKRCLHLVDAPTRSIITLMPDLFDHALQERMQSEAPLAARMRPRALEEF